MGWIGHEKELGIIRGHSLKPFVDLGSLFSDLNFKVMLASGQLFSCQYYIM